MKKLLMLPFLLLGCGSPNYAVMTLEDGSQGVVVECKTEFQCMQRINLFCDHGYIVDEKHVDNGKITEVVRCRSHHNDWDK